MPLWKWNEMEIPGSETNTKFGDIVSDVGSLFRSFPGQVMDPTPLVQQRQEQHIHSRTSPSLSDDSDFFGLPLSTHGGAAWPHPL